MGKPFAFITIPLAIGIFLSYNIHMNPRMIFISLFISVTIYVFYIMKNRANEMVLFLIFLQLGIVLTSYNLNNSLIAKYSDQTMIIRGIVNEILWQEENEGKYVIKVKSIIDKNKSINANEKMVLKIIGDNKVNLGDKITFTGKVKIPMENTNPMLFNYRRNLLSEKIHTTMTIKDYAIMDMDNKDMSFVYKIRNGFKDGIENIFDQSLNIKNSSLMKSIILGEYSYLEEEDIEQYRDLGLAHILAVSGLHIGIITGLLSYILSYLGIQRKMNMGITLSVIWLYGYLIGFPPSLLRANIMLSIIFYGEILKEPYDPINALFFSMFILLIFNPMWIFNLGFQLSFMATFAIIYFTPQIRSLFYPYKNKLTYGLSSIFGVQIGLLPVQAYYFNQISLLSIMGNLIIAPLLSLSLIMGAVMMVLYYPLSALALLMGKILNLVLSLQFYLIDFLYKLPFGIINCYSPGIFEIILYYIFILTLCGVIEIQRFSYKIKKSMVYYLIFLILFNFITMLNDQSIEIQLIDVGQGDAILIKTQRGYYLVDTGGNIMDSFDIGKNITLPYLRKIGINSLKGVFITHFDEDHSKALPLLIDEMDIKNVLISYEDKKSAIYNEVQSTGVSMILLKENDLIYLDKNTWIKILSPTREMFNRKLERNNLSLVFILSYYDKKILFTGDMEREAELELIHRINEPVDIIKVPHHGSNTSSTEELLSKIKPDIGIISVGRNNFYGHPRQEIIDRYEALGTRLYRTDTMGLIKIKLNREDMKIVSFITKKLNMMDILYNNLFYILYYLIAYILIKTSFYGEEELKLDEL